MIKLQLLDSLRREQEKPQPEDYIYINPNQIIWVKELWDYKLEYWYTAMKLNDAYFDVLESPKQIIKLIKEQND